MADRNLTFEEFVKLPNEERCSRYSELSDSDKFRVRCSMDSSGSADDIPCNSCKHNHRNFTCDAFPKGITGEHLDRLEKDSTIECANGIFYEKE